MTVLGKSPVFIARDANQTLRTAICGMLPGLIVNVALWGWMLKTMQEYAAPGLKFLPLDLDASCRKEFLYLRATVLLTAGTSVAALFYRVLGARKVCNGKCTCLIVWLDMLLTLAVCVVFVHGVQEWLKATDEEDMSGCQKMHDVAFWYQVAFAAISVLMLIPALFTVCCVGSARARELEASTYEKLLDNEQP
eukprot:TRINITY_DN89719_c0_g1_i1.p1 TRINITY_DN89719_c0_g1~~TRINITY_DN89719_c0_g1_i1.p1  ORF type:complete len:193 (+),score=34.40 TRINITY_DN89719_c0_g1_i1:44-622(+)